MSLNAISKTELLRIPFNNADGSGSVTINSVGFTVEKIKIVEAFYMTTTAQTANPSINVSIKWDVLNTYVAITSINNQEGNLNNFIALRAPQKIFGNQKFIVRNLAGTTDGPFANTDIAVLLVEFWGHETDLNDLAKVIKDGRKPTDSEPHI